MVLYRPMGCTAVSKSKLHEPTDLKMAILVAGATGHAGQAVLRELLSREQKAG